jgi:hypothetical protein
MGDADVLEPNTAEAVAHFAAAMRLARTQGVT